MLTILVAAPLLTASFPSAHLYSSTDSSIFFTFMSLPPIIVQMVANSIRRDTQFSWLHDPARLHEFDGLSDEEVIRIQAERFVREGRQETHIVLEPFIIRDPSRSSVESAQRRAVEAADREIQQYHALHRRHDSPEVQEQANRRRSSRLPGQHRVYLINCKHCDHFITDRGMKAVLLLRPHITLYSTDAIPNCGPLYPESSMGGTDPSSCQDPTVERTCNCLTQTLGCYGCGAAVGYHIVSPCSRCTSSVAKHQRSSNGHRTVLHCTEINVRERRYVPGEPGVMTAKIDYPQSRNIVPINPPRTDLYSHLLSIQHNRLRRHSVSEAVFHDEREKEQTILPYVEVMEEEHRQSIVQSLAAESTEFRAAPNTNRGGSSGVVEGKKPRLMKAGDTVYWSDLAIGGERHEPIDSDELLALPTCSR